MLYQYVSYHLILWRLAFSYFAKLRAIHPLCKSTFFLTDLRKTITKIRRLRLYHISHCSAHFSAPGPQNPPASVPGLLVKESSARPLSTWLSFQICCWKNKTLAHKPSLDRWGQSTHGLRVRRESLVLKTKLSTYINSECKKTDIKHLPKNCPPFSWEEKKKMIGYELIWKDFMSSHLNLTNSLLCSSSQLIGILLVQAKYVYFQNTFKSIAWNHKNISSKGGDALQLDYQTLLNP